MAWIKRTDSGTWRVQIRKTGYRSQSRTFRLHADAKRWATEIEAKMGHGQQVDIRDLRHRSVRQLFEKYLTEVIAHRKGKRTDTVRVNYLLGTAEFMDRRLDQIRPADFQQWKEQRLREVTPQTVNREMNTLSGAFTYAIKEWLVPLPYNPVRMVKRPEKAKPRRKRRPLPDEVTALVKQLGVSGSTPPSRTEHWTGYALLLAIETAMRIGEICNLERGNIHLDKRYVSLPDTKNDDPRDVPLTRRAAALLEIMLQGVPGMETKQMRARVSLLVPHSPDTLGLRFREACKTLGLPDLHFHDSRREAATRMGKKLSNVLELAAITGHRDLKSLQIYFDPDATELASKLD